MKKSAFVSLVLVSAALASCHTGKPSQWQRSEDPVYYESPLIDSTYTMEYNGNYQSHNPWLWYYSFRPYDTYFRGYYSGAHNSQAYNKVSKVNIHSSGAPVRGGFGRSMSATS